MQVDPGNHFWAAKLSMRIALLLSQQGCFYQIKLAHQTAMQGVGNLPRHPQSVQLKPFCAQCLYVYFVLHLGRNACALHLAVLILHIAITNPVAIRSEEHTSELQSLMRISYAVFCLKKKNTNYPKLI